MGNQGDWKQRISSFRICLLIYVCSINSCSQKIYFLLLFNIFSGYISHKNFFAKSVEGGGGHSIRQIYQSPIVSERYMSKLYRIYLTIHLIVNSGEIQPIPQFSNKISPPPANSVKIQKNIIRVCDKYFKYILKILSQWQF